jgi:hypothetical protein
LRFVFAFLTLKCFNTSWMVSSRPKMEQVLTTGPRWKQRERPFLSFQAGKPFYSRELFNNIWHCGRRRWICAIFFSWSMWTSRWVMNVQMRVHILRTFVTHLLVHIHQKKKVALEIAEKIASVEVQTQPTRFDNATRFLSFWKLIKQPMRANFKRYV